MAFASLLGTSASWSETVKLYGPIALGVLAALDSYGGFIEFGLYLNSYDKRLEVYQDAMGYHKRAEFEQAQAAKFALREKELDAKLAQLESKPEAKPAKIEETVQEAPKQAPTVDQLNEARLESKRARMRATLQAFAADPHATQADVGQAVGVSRATVGNYLAELEDMGKVKRNGQGVEVLSNGGVK